MAFAPPLSTTVFTNHRTLPLDVQNSRSPSRYRTRTSPARIPRTPLMTSESPLPEDSTITTPIPSSLSGACQNAIAAAQIAAASGQRRMFVEIDTTGGDATYTMLKKSLPITRMLLPFFTSPEQAARNERVVVLLPDSGAAALASRDWSQLTTAEQDDLPTNFELLGIEQADLDVAQDAGVVVVVPRASEVEKLGPVVDSAGDLPVIIVNPDLVDMGVTGLSLNARRLRTSLIDTFEVVYYLKVFNWGVLLRAYPGRWGIWVDEPGSAVGFRLISELDHRPSLEDIDNALDADGDAGTSSSANMFTKLQRFLKVYMKG